MTRQRFENKNKFEFNIKNLKVYLLSGVCCMLAIVSIFMTIESATSGGQIASLQKQETQLLAQQQDLQEALVQGLSIASLQDKSAELGFVQVNNLVYVSDGTSVARLPISDTEH